MQLLLHSSLPGSCHEIAENCEPPYNHRTQNSCFGTTDFYAAAMEEKNIHAAAIGM
jgi:hypothetical protein